MSHRTVERIIGRLLTDEDLRLEFAGAPRRTLKALRDQGWDLTRIEIDALIRTDARLWSDAANRIDPKLQRCSLKTSEETADR
jgi:hypothetical protein